MANKQIHTFNLPPVTFNKPILIKTSYVNNIYEAINEIAVILEKQVPPASHDKVYLLALALYLRDLDFSLDIRIWKYSNDSYYITVSAVNIGEAEPSEVVYEVLEVNRIMADYNIEEHRRAGAPVMHVSGGPSKVVDSILALLTGSMGEASESRIEVREAGLGEFNLVYEGEAKADEAESVALVSTESRAPRRESCIEDLWRGCISNGCVVKNDEIIVYGSSLKMVRGRGARYVCIYEDISSSCKRVEIVLDESGREEINCIN